MPELHFKGKEFVYNHHLTVPYRPLLPHPDKSIGEPALNGNLIIQGDNLHALKALLPLYADKVDCIFIDPPYNTGNESWCYNDNVNSPMMREWLSSNPVNREDMLRHDKWLALMYPRIKLLHELLADTGSFWMTLDDNEIHRARMIMDEIFGEENCLGVMSWQKVYSSRMDADGFSKDLDAVLVYAKNKSEVFMAAQFMTQNERQFTYIEPETGKKARLRSLRKEGSSSLRADRENMWYPIEAPDGEMIYPIKPDGTEGRWRWEESTFLKEKSKPNPNFLIQKNSSGEWEVWVKQYFKGDSEKPISTLLRHEEYGHTHAAAEEIKEIFGRKAFDTPKPKKLIMGILELALPVEGIVLDSFAGSATTAHAVLALNAEDAGDRKFILVECEDYADTLTAERVRRIINGYEFTGTHREELLRENITFTSLKKANKLLLQVDAIENLEKHRFDTISKTVKDGVLIVSGERNVKECAEGLGGSFTYCTLGEPLDLDKLLTGENLPSYEALGAWAFHTATGDALNPERIDQAHWFLGESAGYFVWLVYKPDLGFLKSSAAALTLKFAETITQAKTGKRHLVFAPAKFAPNKTLLPMGVDYAPLPFALYRVEKL